MPALSLLAVTKSLLKTRATGVLLVLALLLLWELSARLQWVRSSNWPPFSAVASEALGGIFTGELAIPLMSTVRRMLTGYVLGCSAGIALGLVLGTNRWVRYVVQPIIETIRPLPVPAIVPPLILFLGVDDGLKIFVVALSCFYPAFTNTLAGVVGIDEVLLQTARTFRTGPLRTVMQVVLPAILPSIASGLRVAVGLALVVTIVAEMIAGSAGAGYYIVQMQYAMRPESMYAAVIWLAIIGYTLNRLFLAAETRLIPWMGRA